MSLTVVWLLVSHLLWPICSQRSISPQICVIYLLHQKGSCGLLLSHWFVAVMSSCVLADFIITGVGVQLSFLCLLRKFLFQCSLAMISILDMFLFTVNLCFLIYLQASACFINGILPDKMPFSQRTVMEWLTTVWV